MSNPDSLDTTELSIKSVAGDSKATTKLMDVVYDELRALANSYLARERVGHSLQPTALVHEVYIKLIDQKRIDWKGRTHFFAIGAKAMRRILIDHGRERKRLKRGGGMHRLSISDDLGVSPESTEDYVVLGEVLDQLRERDERQAEIVELRFFGGMKMSEIAEKLGVSKRSVESDWTMAKTWLRRALSEEHSP